MEGLAECSMVEEGVVYERSCQQRFLVARDRMEALEAFSEKKPRYSGGDECPAVGNLDFSNTYLVYQREPTEQHTKHIATPPHQTLLGRFADTF